MRLGVVFPQTEATPDPGAIREFGRAVEEMGFDSISVFDHVLGADPANRAAPWRGPYTHENAFHEQLILLAYLAAITTRVILTTYVLILPQRQAPLVAKQAAELAALSSNRLRLGVGIGWNRIEIEALGASFEARASRFEEQLILMTELWTKPLVDFVGRWHRIDRVGLNPRPAQPIPVWVGGGSMRAAERAGRLGDGWLPMIGSLPSPFRWDEDPASSSLLAERLTEHRNAMWAAAVSAGKDPKSMGIGIDMDYSLIEALGRDTDVAAEAAAYEAFGVTDITLNVMKAGLKWPDGHLAALERCIHSHGEELRGTGKRLAHDRQRKYRSIARDGT